MITGVGTALNGDMISYFTLERRGGYVFALSCESYENEGLTHEGMYAGTMGRKANILESGKMVHQ